MKLKRQTFDQQNYSQKARRVRNQASKVLENWGLKPRFKRWRLSKDPDSGMIVLFGILNKKYIDRQTSILFNDYFDQRLLLNLANKLQVQVVSSKSDSMHYAFILSRGQIDMHPINKDITLRDEDRLFRVAYSDEPVLEVIEH